MDESWRIRMVMPSRQRRRSIEAQEPNDFDDVFGGPPRSVFQRRFSGDFVRSSSTLSSSLYEEIFGHREFLTPSNKRGGRSLPAFRIPAKGEGFYSDVFGAEESGRRSRERSRPTSKGKSYSNSSSVLSSEELSPLRQPETGDDAAFYSFASKIRPINAPCRWNSATMTPEGQPGKQGMPSFPYNAPSYTNDYHIQDDYSENFCGSYHKVSQHVSSPETISLGPQSYRSFKVSADDLEFNSSSSPVSSLCHEVPETKDDTPCDPTPEEEMEQDEDDDDDDEAMSSYVIEINSDYREGTDEAICIDEAIAWAKEKYQTQSFVKIHEKEHSAKGQESYSTNKFMDQQISEQERMQSLVEEELKKWTRAEEKERSKEDVDKELLDEDLKLWSAGKETNIRLLLSTLHHILWPNSGWHAISLTKLIESSHVKKAYQKARLCLHPDKLQQRQATLTQKHVAEKAFSVLQDAWDAFISHDVLF